MNFTEREQKVVELTKQNKIDSYIQEYENEILNLQKKGIIDFVKVPFQNGKFIIGGISLNDNYFD